MERVFSDPNTVGEMLRRLEARKLVQRKPHPRDRRARCVFLTSKGRTFQRRLHEDSLAFHRQFEDTFTAAERSVLSELLGRIPAAMESMPLSPSEAVA
jgi:DNA-binding MarR family transcriptional regulator